MKLKSKEISCKKTAEDFSISDHQSNNNNNNAITKINPWTLLEDYPNGPLSPSSFGGEKFTRTSLRYANSILDFNPNANNNNNNNNDLMQITKSSYGNQTSSLSTEGLSLTSSMNNALGLNLIHNRDLNFASDVFSPYSPPIGGKRTFQEFKDSDDSFIL